MDINRAIRSIKVIQIELENLLEVLNAGRDQTTNRDGGQGQDQEEEVHVNVDGTPDKRFAENRPEPTGQGEVRDPEHDRRLKENRPEPMPMTDSKEAVRSSTTEQALETARALDLSREERENRLEELTHGRKRK